MVILIATVYYRYNVTLISPDLYLNEQFYKLVEPVVIALTSFSSSLDVSSMLQCVVNAVSWPYHL